MSTAAPPGLVTATGPATVTTVAPTPAGRERLVSLDVFRGATIAGMLLVNNPGTWSAIYPPLRHAAWHGWTPTDLIFPFFLFIVGITTHLSLTARRARGATDAELLRQVLRRGAIIILLGLLLALFPVCSSLVLGSDPQLVCGADAIRDRLATLRFPGVLQRIGLVYIVAGLLALRTTLRTQIAIAAVLLFGYWAVMTVVPVPGTGVPGWRVLDEPSASIAAWLDRTIFGAHLWAGSKTWDPEGLLSTVPAIATALLGLFAGRWLGTSRPLPERLAALFAVGAIVMAVGGAWGWIFPINKPLWTSSYVLFTGGMAAVALGVCVWLIDERRSTGWTRPFVVFGVNPILAFVGAGMMARLLYTVIKVPYEGEVVPLQAAIYRSAFAPWLPAEAASLLFAVVFVLLWYGILSVLYRRNIYLKV